MQKLEQKVSEKEDYLEKLKNKNQHLIHCIVSC